jgi:hypothetical protein
MFTATEKPFRLSVGDTVRIVPSFSTTGAVESAIVTKLFRDGSGKVSAIGIRYQDGCADILDSGMLRRAEARAKS